MRPRDVTFVGLLVAVLVSGGYVLYLISRALPIPGAKFLVLSPYLALTMAVALRRLSSRWAMTLVSLVFGAVISIFTPVMGVTIPAAGLLADISTRVWRNRELSDSRLIGVAATYPCWSLLLALSVTNYLTGNSLFGLIGPAGLALSALLAYSLGAGGAALGLKILHRTEPPASLGQPPVRSQ